LPSDYRYFCTHLSALRTDLGERSSLVYGGPTEVDDDDANILHISSSMVDKVPGAIGRS
jgi:hypothetical protein